MNRYSPWKYVAMVVALAVGPVSALAHSALNAGAGVRFVLKVDMESALSRKLDSDATVARALMRERTIHDKGVNRVGQSVTLDFPDQTTADRARAALAERITGLQWAVQTLAPPPATGVRLVGTFTPAQRQWVQQNALRQNIAVLHNRANELGVSAPLIQPQGDNRIVVELPGVQDTAKARNIIGRTVTLEARLADPDSLHPNPNDPVPPGDELFTQGDSVPVWLRKQAILTGDSIIGASAASAGIDTQKPAVNIRLNPAGGDALRRASLNNIGKPMAIVLFEKGKGQVLMVTTIQSELGERFQITNRPSMQAANDLALLLRTGSLAAPVDIVEERTISPSQNTPRIKTWARFWPRVLLALPTNIVTSQAPYSGPVVRLSSQAP